MLYLIGLGLNDENDLTLKAVEIAKKCECFIELYTSIWKGSLENLKEIIKKDINVLNRKDLEENLELFIEKAKKNDIALFVPGDPLAATTHIDVVFEAKRKKIPVKIIHNASIFSAIGETGLQIYKFGKTATIPLSGKMANVKKTVKTNKKHGFHTIAVCKKGREKTYTKYYKTRKDGRGCIDETIVLDKFSDITKPNVQEELRKKK